MVQSETINEEYVVENGFWRAQIAAWAFLAVFGFCIRLFVFQSVAVAVVCTLVTDSLGFLLTSLMARQPFMGAAPRRSMRTWALAALWSMSIALILALVAYRLRVGLAPTEEPAIHGNAYAVGLMYHLSIVTVWTLAYLGVSAEIEARTQRMHVLAAQAHALRLEVESLQLQIAPHFLFNALNTLVSEIGGRPAIAQEMTRQLAAYLRYSLRKRDQYVAPLADELEAVEMYIRIQALRFDERFSYSCQVDPAALSASIPHMAIQCLVENAIKHGLQAGQSDFEIHVRVTGNDDELRVDVDNPSGAKVLAPQEKTGTGLANMRRRLELRYPERHAFSLTQQSGRTTATLSLQGKPCFV
jgi:hypothetical protein